MARLNDPPQPSGETVESRKYSPTARKEQVNILQ